MITNRVSGRLIIGAALVVLGNLAMITSLGHRGSWGWNLLIGGSLFTAVAIVVRREAARAPIWWIMIITVAVQLPGLFLWPLTSDDAYRYVWDGRVQLAAIDPYQYAPLDPALSHLRDALLFPDGRPPLINRPGVPTVYPPVAQVWFVLIAASTPWTWGTLGVQVGAAAAVLATTLLLARFLGDRPGWALLYGGCPLVALEAASGAHLDALAALCIFGVGWAATRRRHWLAGVLLGLAAGIKLVPLLLVPVFLRHGRWRTTVGSVGLLLASYVPHIAAAGTLVLGFLSGYWREEGYDGKKRFALLLWLPDDLRLPVALALALALAVVAVLRSGREPVLQTCCWLYGSALLLATPIYPWYALPFVVLVIMARRLEWLAVWAATYVAFVFDHEIYAQTVAYTLALVAVVLVGMRRALSVRLPEVSIPANPGSPPSAPAPAASSRSRQH